LFAKCKSEWQTPQYFISICTSWSPTARRLNRIGLKSQHGSLHAMANASTIFGGVVGGVVGGEF
jgi:hypothetical protein